MSDRTLVLCKPDCVERGLVGEVIARLERKQLRIVALELRLLEEIGQAIAAWLASISRRSSHSGSGSRTSRWKTSRTRRPVAARC